MKPLQEMKCSNVQYLFFDIDDTFSTHGKISQNAYSSLWNLHHHGIKIIPVTGRPAGWCDHIARMWPVDAIVGENGAFYFMMKNGKLQKYYLISDDEKKLNRLKLEDIKNEILSNVKKVKVAKDQDYREFDLAIDFAEEVLIDDQDEKLRTIDQIEKIFKNHGAISKVSSIHVNGWFGCYDKLNMSKELAQNEFSLDLNQESDNKLCIYCGDSPNDAPMFNFFHLSVGVRNVLDFQNQLKHFPKYVTQNKYGDGFKEIADKVISSRV
ncbi:MAG: HAD-IIB family hydrolase [Oligoflexia bacterium]|nr:HAD-IIB family hydrolase [Oligoflexia bacterium]